MLKPMSTGARTFSPVNGLTPSRTASLRLQVRNARLKLMLVHPTSQVYAARVERSDTRVSFKPWLGSHARLGNDETTARKPNIAD